MARIHPRKDHPFSAVLTPLTEAALHGDAPRCACCSTVALTRQAAGFMPLAFSMRAHCDGCVTALTTRLREEQVLTPTMLQLAPPRGTALSAASLLARGADPNARGANGFPMLLLVAASDARPLDVVRALIDKGADVNAQGPHGETAMMFARLRNAGPLVDILLKAGARNEVPTPRRRSRLRRHIRRRTPSSEAFPSCRKPMCSSCMSPGACRATTTR
jgi:hypothetical protein